MRIKKRAFAELANLLAHVQKQSPFLINATITFAYPPLAATPKVLESQMRRSGTRRGFCLLRFCHHEQQGRTTS